MSDRCNLVIVEAGRVELRESRWGGDRLDADLLWGPEHAIALARGWRGADEGAEWHDEAWARGAALIDPGGKRLLWWGGRVDADVLERRVFLPLLAAAWPGWKVGWAGEGMVAIAEAAGVGRARVHANWDPEAAELDDLGEEGDTLLTVRKPDGSLTWARTEAPWFAVGAAGLALIERAAALPARAPAALRPTAGVHVDLGARRLDAWQSSVAADHARRLAPHFPGWTIGWHDDRIEEHLSRAAGAWTLAPRGDDEILAGLREHLLEEDTAPPDLGALASWLGKFADAIELDRTTAADQKRQRPLPVADRTARLDRAMAAIRS